MPESCNYTCRQLQRIEALESSVERNEAYNRESHREFHGKLDLIGRFEAVTNERYSNILSLVEKTASSLEELKTKPAKKWEKLVSTVIISVVSALVGFVMARVLS